MFHLTCLLFDSFRKFTDEETQIFFALMDRDGSSRIEKDEFMYFSKVMLLEFKRMVKKPTFMQRNFPSIYESDGFQVSRLEGGKCFTNLLYLPLQF